MPELPRHFAPWTRELALFPPDIALVLGGFVSRLAGLIGEGPAVRATEGEPDGYDGVARKGSYERLLAAEWLLLEEVPEEFLRRVVTSEHMFLDRAYARHAGARRCVALFDASTDQLGAPRLAHLAVLVILAQRATTHGATFEWGIVQDAATTLHSGVTATSVLTLLRSRGARPIVASELDHWTAKLQAASESWLIGPPSLEREASRLRASLISSADVIEPGPARIVVRVTTPFASKTKEVVLDVPEERAAVRLLRDPFSTAVASRTVASTAIDPQSQMVFSPNAQLLYVRTAPSSLISVQVPNSSRATSAPPVTFNAPDGHTIHAVGRSLSTKRTLVLSRGDDGMFVLHRLSKRGATATMTDRYLPPFEGDAIFYERLQPLAVMGERRYCLADRDGTFLELRDGTTRIRRSGRVIATAAQPNGFSWLEIDDDRTRAMWMAPSLTSDGGDIPPLEVVTSTLSMQEIQSLRFAGGPAGIFAYATSSTSWTIVGKSRRTPVTVDAGANVVAVMSQYYGGGEGLVALNEERTRIELLTHTHRATLVTTSATVTSLVASGRANEFAYLTEEGELAIYSTRSKSVVTRLGGDAP